MNKVEDFFEEVRKAIVSIPKKPNLIMKEANVIAIKLNSEMIDKLTKYSYVANEKDYKTATLMGVKFYLDETVNRPKYIVEGEIMASFHPEALKGNSIKSYAIDEAVNPSDALNSLENLRKSANTFCQHIPEQCELNKKYADTIKQALQSKSLAEECWEIVKNKPFILQKLFENKGLEKQQEYDKKYFWGTATDEEVAKVKEGLK